MQALWKTVRKLLKKTSRVVIWPCNPTPGHLSGQNYNSKHTGTPMLTAALFTMAKTWKQHKYPLKDEWIKMCLCICMYIYTYIYVYIYTCIYIHRHTHIYIHNGILLSHKKEWNTICNNMHRPRDYLSKWSKSEKTNTKWCHLYVESKIWHKWIYVSKRNRLTDIENSLMVAKEDRGRMDWECGISRCKLLYIG